MPLQSQYDFRRLGGGGGSATITCPFQLTPYNGTVDIPVPPGQVAFQIGPGMVNNVLIKDGTTAATPGLIYYISIGDTTQLLCLSINLTDVAVQGGLVFLGNPGPPPTPKPDFPEASITVPLFYFSATGDAVRIIGCNNICLSSYVAFTQNKLSQTGINDYPYTNYWSWAIFS